MKVDTRATSNSSTETTLILILLVLYLSSVRISFKTRHKPLNDILFDLIPLSKERRNKKVKSFNIPFQLQLKRTSQRIHLI